ncbi:MAG TPA: branched-chain amino acid ABC transporter permease [Actinomycetota bacterium]|nr:branched-chain amino acid ABC transporter permease [Actinomycetota bacterium]
MPGSQLTRQAVRAGLIGGAALVYVALTGMVEKFDSRNLIGSFLTLGNLLIALPPLLSGYLATRPRVVGGQREALAPRGAVTAGLLSGAIVGGVTAAGVALVELLPEGAVRRIFIQVSPELLNILTFGRGVPVGLVLLVLYGAVLGLLGGGFRLLPARIAQPVGIGLATTLTFALLQRIFPPLLFELGLDTRWLYSPILLGLTIPGALLVFAVSAGLTVLWSTRGSAAVHKRLDPLPPERRRVVNAIIALVIAAALLVLPQLIGSTLSQVLGQVGVFLLMGLGLNIVVGYAGLLDLGYVAFFATGAYLTALFTGANRVTSIGDLVAPAFVLHLNFYLAVPLVIAVTAMVGVLIGAPVLRLRGDYLAIVTLGFGEIARVLVQSSWLQEFTGGPQGLRDVTDAAIGGFGFRDPQPFFYLVLVFCVLAIFVSLRLANSRVGRAWSAMREDELAAEAMGVSTTKYKLLAFAMGAAVGCLSGTLFAVQIGSIASGSFTILVSITVLAIVILGGMGSIPGVVVGTLLLIGLPGLLDEFEEYRLLIYGAALIMIMVLRPQGLVPNVRRMRELQEEETAQDQWLKQEEAESASAITVGGGGAS